MLISPSVLGCDLSRLAEEAATVSSSAMLHLDVMDGVFVPNISFGMPVIKALRKHSSLFFDVHLMIADPLPYVERFAEAGADLITVHYEAENAVASLKKIRELGKKAGLSVKPGTPVEEIYPLLELCDLVLIMTVEPGFGGQAMIPECLEKAKKLQKFKQETGSDFLIEADGGITFDNLSSTGEYGVEVAVMGSAVFKIPASERNAAIEKVSGKAGF